LNDTQWKKQGGHRNRLPVDVDVDVDVDLDLTWTKTLTGTGMIMAFVVVDDVVVEVVVALD